MSWSPIAAVLAVCLATSCGDRYGQAGEQGDFEASFDEVEALIKERCENCHGYEPGTAGVELPGDIERELATGEFLLVVPGDAEASLLWRVLSDGEMPAGRPLASERYAHVKEWIDAGAPLP